MDRTQLNIISIILGGAAILLVIKGYNVPEVNMTFYDSNPFGVKRDAIVTAMKWVSALVALVGICLRLFVEIKGEGLRTRSRNWKGHHYVIFCASWIIAIGIMVVVLNELGNKIARSQWEPTVIQGQHDNFEHAKFVAEHDGEPNERKEAEHDLGIIEELLEVESSGDLRQRVERLQPKFATHR
jgi:hypothetical protein